MIFTPKGNILDGVFSYYNKKKRSIFDFVNVVSIGTFFKDGWSEPYVLVRPPKEEVKLNDNWCSPNITNSFVQISLLKETLILSSYTIKSRTYIPSDMISSWNVYGSLDGKTFELIDTKLDRPELLTNNQSNYVPDKPNFKLKYIKIEQIINSRKRFYMCLNRIELFGKLFRDEYCTIGKSAKRCGFKFVCVAILIC